MLDMTIFSPRQTHRGLAYLGREQWLVTKPDPSYPGRTMFGFPKVTVRCPESERAGIEQIMKVAREKALNACYFFPLSRALASGPKWFRPTEEQAEAMLEVEARIVPSEYQQAYPQLVVEVPSNVRKIVAEKYGIAFDDVPRAVMLHHEFGFFCFTLKFRTCEYSCTFCTETPAATIEEALVKLHPEFAYEDSVSWEGCVAVDLQRMAVNLSYLLVHVGSTIDGNYRKQVGKKRPDLAQGTPFEVKLAQEVTIRRVRRYRCGGDGTHASPRPHWRRGHWARVACGAGRLERKLVFRRPTYVMFEALGADLSETSVEIFDKS